MKFILLLLLSASVACSGDVKKKQTPKNKMNKVESPSVNSRKPQTIQNQEHISGTGETHVSGTPSSSHISGK